MEVIEKAKPAAKWTKIVICTGVVDVRIGCYAKLKIDEDDLFRIKIGNRGKERYAAQFQCPDCHVRSDFFGYPNPSVLLDYYEHPSHRAEGELYGYQVERRDRRIWNSHETFLQHIGYRIDEKGDVNRDF